MEKQRTVTLTINDEKITEDVDVRLNLVDFIRQNVGLTGSHVGCEHGVCGACTLLVNGEIVRGCLMLAVQADNCVVETIEGLSDAGELQDLQSAFLKHNAAQCGFCSPGMLLTARELVKSGSATNRKAIREYISGNYCRCTGYQAIVDAIEEVAQSSATEEDAR